MTEPETQQDLAEKMRALLPFVPEADRAQFAKLADHLDASITASPFSARRMLGCWARARKAWCEVTGEPLV